MECPHCHHQLGNGVLPARCPYCGAYFGSVGQVERGGASARRASQIRREVEGLVGPRQYKRGGVGSFLVALLLIAIAVGGVAGIARYLGFFGDVRIPDVKGWRLERAENELEARGFVVDHQMEASEERVGFVLRTEPAANDLLERGGLVVVYTARERSMPEVVGRDISEVREELDKMGVAYIVREIPSSEKVGTVLSSSKEAGEPFGYQETIQLVAASAYKVPNVMGMSEAEALGAIADMGLVASVEYVEASSGQQEDTVVGVSPDVGTELSPGDTVYLRVVDYARDPATVANRIIEVIYNTAEPDTIGANLRRYLSTDLMVKDQTTNEDKPALSATDFEIWYGVVKNWNRFPNTGGPEQSLPRELIQAPQISVYGDTVSAYIQVRWDEAAAGGGQYWYGHTITMEFDDHGKLVSFVDPEADVPRNLIVAQ